MKFKSGPLPKFPAIADISGASAPAPVRLLSAACRHGVATAAYALIAANAWHLFDKISSIVLGQTCPSPGPMLNYLTGQQIESVYL